MSKDTKKITCQDYLGSLRNVLSGGNSDSLSDFTLGVRCRAMGYVCLALLILPIHLFN